MLVEQNIEWFNIDGKWLNEAANELITLGILHLKNLVSNDKKRVARMCNSSLAELKAVKEKWLKMREIQNSIQIQIQWSFFTQNARILENIPKCGLNRLFEDHSLPAQEHDKEAEIWIFPVVTAFCDLPDSASLIKIKGAQRQQV
uniref:Uncharacterized protein n=1 Tax=Romanomermis culicivorax TaxID=13658 RepID=A0A915HJP7_ROMCU